MCFINCAEKKDDLCNISSRFRFEETTVEAIVSNERPISSFISKLRDSFHYIHLRGQVTNFEEQAIELGQLVGSSYQYVLLQRMIEQLDTTYDYVVFGVDARDDLWLGNALFASTNEISLIERERLTTTIPSHFHTILREIQRLKETLQLPTIRRQSTVVQHPERLRQFISYRAEDYSFPFSHKLFTSFRTELHNMITQNIEEMVLDDYKEK